MRRVVSYGRCSCFCCYRHWSISSSWGVRHMASTVSPCWRRCALLSAIPAYASHSPMMLHRVKVSFSEAYGNGEPPGPSAPAASLSFLQSAAAIGGDDNGGECDGPVEVRFYEHFHITEEDVHYALLHEAYVKHGVLLNVPPQLSPSGSPPEVPDVILPTAQVERMRGLKLAYEPTHLPPPLHTTGTRKLVIENVQVVGEMAASKKSASVASASASGSVAVTCADNSGVLAEGGGGGGAKGNSTGTTTAVVRRLHPDPTMRFHCSSCGKAFRLQFSAEHHVKLKHTSDEGATVADGPGPGEIIEEAEPVATAVAPATLTAASSTEAAAPDEAQKQNALKVAFGAVKVPYTKAMLTLPSEELIDELLGDVWDSVASHREDVPKANQPNAYVPFSDVVQGTADRRKEMEAQAKPTARATPEGAAPGIKKPAVSSGVAMMVGGKSRVTGSIVPIKELVKKYPNPFGDSPNAALQELENEPINPFIPQDELALQLQVAKDKEKILCVPAAPPSNASAASHMGDVKDAQEKLKEKLRASRPSLTRSASQRRFSCPICAEEQQQRGICEVDTVPSFRLLDALLDHVETVHEGRELTDTQLHALYKTQRKSALLGPQSIINSQDSTNGALRNLGDPSINSRDNDDGAVDKSIFPEELRQAVPPAAVEQRMLSVHVRASSNAVMLGRIADVQHGFLGTVAVTQYVLEVCDDATVNAEEGNAASVVDPEKEFIVIRCMGDNFPAALLKEQVKLGSMVLVQGTLRMNRHIDDASKRLHAYPFVQVVPPLGCVKVLG